MQIKKDDMVVVIAGKDKGKTGQVLRTIPKKNKVVVEGVNMQTKHAKATRTSGSEIKHMEGPIDASNVMFYDKEAKTATRIGHKIEDRKDHRLGKEEQSWKSDLRTSIRTKFSKPCRTDSVTPTLWKFLN